ncbi:MAG: PhnD/SsuA/transferrin family substrate-binding protein [Chloroflexota bacterium]
MSRLLFTHYLSSVIDPACQALTTKLSLDLGVPVHYFDADWSDRMMCLENQEPHVAWICGLLHVCKSAQSDWPYEAVAAPMMRGTRYQQMPVYFTDLIVRRESLFESIEALQGASWAINETTSLSGYHMMKCWMNEQQIAEDFFGDHIMTGTHLNSVTAVLNGEADFATIDSTTMDMLFRESPAKIRALRVIQSIGPFPAPPIVIHKDCKPELKEQVRSIVTNLHLDPQYQAQLEQTDIAGFSTVDEQFYNSIRVINVSE